MRSFQSSSRLDRVNYEVRGPLVDEAARMEAAGQKVIKLNIGNPYPFGFRAPDSLVRCMSDNLASTQGYSDSKGMPSARRAILAYVQGKGIPNVDLDDIYTGNGASELINTILMAMLEPGDEVLVPAPDYPLWTGCVNLAGGTAVHYICDESARWYPDMDDIRSKITSNTKAIVVINPNNPTGAVYPKEVLEEIVEIARCHELIILCDEIYDRLLMDDVEHTSIASLCPDLFCVTFSGLSKSHMIAGFRIGWMVLSGNKNAAKGLIEGINLLSSMRLCSNAPAQSIVECALNDIASVKSYVVPGGRLYEQREVVCNALNAIEGISVVKPQGAFYCFPKLDIERFGIHDDQKFALDLLHEKQLLIIQGTGFNWPAPDHFRVVYLPDVDLLKDAMGRLGDFLSTYRQS